MAGPLGSDENQLLSLLPNWFGENAGALGTHYQVTCSQAESGWTVEPIAISHPLLFLSPTAETVESGGLNEFGLPGFVESPGAKDRYTRLVPVYSLEAAAGL